jgi:hypothetical protein
MTMSDVEAYIARRDTSPTEHHRRPSKAETDFEVFVKRGSWKRRGVVFHLDLNEEAQQELLFEMPESSPEEPQGSYFDISP